MQVYYFASLRQVVGKRSEAFQFKQNQTLGDLLDEIVNRYPAITNEVHDSEGALYGHIRIFVNGADVSYREDLFKLKLGEEDRIDIFPAIGGGCSPTFR